MRTIFFLMLFVFGFPLLDAQERQRTYELSVQVLNGDTGFPMNDADISIQPCDCGGVSDVQGRFAISLPSTNYRVTVSFIGFKDAVRNIVLDKDTFLQLVLYVQEEQLSEVVVQAKKITDHLLTPEMGVLRLETQDLSKVPAAVGEFDVLRGMTLLAGVNSAGEVSNGLSVRGGSLDQNLVLYDYAPVFNPTHLFGLFSVFTPDVLSSVDLYRANIPARFGGRVTSVLDIKTKNPYVDKLKLKGGIGLVSSRFSLETPLIKDKLLLGAGGRAGFTDFLLPLFSERLDNTKARFYDATLKLLYLPTSKDQIAFTGFYAKDFYQLDLISQVENISAESNQYDFRTLNGTLNWLHSFDGQTNLRTVLVSSDYLPKIIFPELDNSNEIEFESKIKYLSFNTEFSKEPSERFRYYLGIQANRYRISPGNLDPGTSPSVLPVSLERETSYEISGFLNTNWELTDFLSLSTGLRYNYYTLRGPFAQPIFNATGDAVIDTQLFDKGEEVQSYDDIEPRLGAVIKINDHNTIKASYASLNQYLQNVYNSTTPLPTSRWKTADADIRPQRGNSYSLGVYHTSKNGAIEMSLEGYYRDTENVLTYRPGADFFLEEFLQTSVLQGQGRNYGVEFSLRRPKGKVNGWLNYTWSRSILRTTNENPLDRINNNQWFNSDFDRPHVLNATINFEGDAYNVWSLNFTGQSGRPFTVANGVFEFENLDVPIFLERNNARLPVYHRLDFSWKVRYAKKANKRWVGDWTFTVYNVYGRKNPINIFFDQRNGPENSDIFLDSPLGAYEISLLNSPLFALTYNFTFQ
ncbi:carboxypeptidase-like regulatory domain-containing protein [Flavobacteriaceae bacterium 3-367]|uniref:TonB-dependent receptor n=1 Tax=Eudoraea algarum TaxID=3417568 RepID=UPI00326ED7C2